MSIIFPTGLYAFHKIKKLRIGIIIYGISEVIAYSSLVVGGSMLYLTKDWWPIIAPLALAISILSIVMPIIFMRKYCIEYNEKIKTENMSVI